MLMVTVACTAGCNKPDDPITPSAPTGFINSTFTINENGDKVYFSQGNLRYQASTNTWRFADHQWDCFGESQEGDSQAIDRDLFGWGTSGYNHGAIAYQPWSTSLDAISYFAYGDMHYSLNDQTGKADWGYNAIINGGNAENCGWRTLTFEEWDYLFNERPYFVSDYSFAKANVNYVNGVILLPDDWKASYYELNGVNRESVGYDVNIITASQWDTLERHGAVFLPAAGCRIGTSVQDFSSFGLYWSSSCVTTYFCYSWGMVFNDETINADDPYENDTRHIGGSVRLVRDAE